MAKGKPTSKDKETPSVAEEFPIEEFHPTLTLGMASKRHEARMAKDKSDNKAISELEEFPMEELSLSVKQQGSNARDKSLLDAHSNRNSQPGSSSHKSPHAAVTRPHGKLVRNRATEQVPLQTSSFEEGRHTKKTSRSHPKDSKFRQGAEQESQISAGNSTRPNQKASKFRERAQHNDEESQLSPEPNNQYEERQQAQQQAQQRARPGAEHIRGPASGSTATLGTIIVGDETTTASVRSIEESRSIHAMLQAELVSDKTVDAVPVTDETSSHDQNRDSNQKITRHRACIVIAVGLILVVALSGGITGAVLGLSQSPTTITSAPTSPPSIPPLPTCSMAIEMECFEAENSGTSCEYIERPSRTCERTSARSQFSKIPTAIILRYDGGNCSQYPPGDSLLECTDYSEGPTPSSNLFVSAWDTRSSRPFRSNVPVALNQFFSVHVDNVLALGATTMIDIASSSSTPPFQSVLIQSDCSTKMSLGDYFGPFELVAIYNDDQGRIRRQSKQITYRSVVRNEGTENVTLSSFNWTTNFGSTRQTATGENVTISPENSTIVLEETIDIVDLSLRKRYEANGFVSGVSVDGLSCNSSGRYVFTAGAPTMSPTHSTQPSWIPTGIPSFRAETVTPSGGSIWPPLASPTLTPASSPVIPPVASPVIPPVTAFPLPMPFPPPVAAIPPSQVATPFPTPAPDRAPSAPSLAQLPTSTPISFPSDSCDVSLDIDCSIDEGESSNNFSSCNNGDSFVPSREECLDAPFAMDFLFTGGDCSVSWGIQLPSSFQCTDFLSNSTENITDSYVVVSDTSNSNVVLFEGFVSPGGRFRIEDFTGNSISASSVTVNVYLSSEKAPENLFQTVIFDISCSGGNFLLDRYGSIQLVGFASDAQGVVSTIVRATYSFILSSLSEGTLLSLISLLSPGESSYNYTGEVSGISLNNGDNNEPLVIEQPFSIDFAVPQMYTNFATVEFSIGPGLYICRGSAFFNFTTIGI